MAWKIPFTGGEREEAFTTPWARRDPTVPGLYIGHDKSVWVYREFPLTPLQWEDPEQRLTIGRRLAALLEDLGATSKPIGGGLRALSRNREVHVVSIAYGTFGAVPDGTPDGLAPFLSDLLDEVVPDKTLLVGVKLRSTPTAALNAASRGGVAAQAKAALALAGMDNTTNLDAYRTDLKEIEGLLRKAGTAAPSTPALRQLESWYNGGRGPDAAIAAADTRLHVSGSGTFEMSALMRFDSPVLQAPYSQWLLDAMTHPEGANVVSVRAELEPPQVTRARVRHSQRKVRAQMEEEAATGDIEREENSETFQLAQEVENFVRTSREPMLTNTSIVFARRVDETANETFLDFLAGVHGIEAKPLEKRQIGVLEETLPCARRRVNPFVQDLSIGMIAYAGLPSFSTLGDDSGCLLGHVDPDYVPFYVDPYGAPRANKPPVMAVFGDPGSGKTFACQLLAAQSVFGSVSTIMVNPKGFDTLKPFADYIARQGFPSRVVSMRKMEEQGGAFDPFRFCEPQAAAEIATSHIATVLGNGKGLDAKQEILLGDGLARGAAAGARCVRDALEYVEDREIVELVLMQARASTLFALGIGNVEQPEWTDEGGLTLIEFDRELPLPDPKKDASSYEMAERVALAAMRLVTRASMEILMKADGGVLVVDEAHTYLSSPEGLKSLQRIGREGRSLNLLPVFATQRIADVMNADLAGYLSRVLVMALSDEVEASAALELCGLRATSERIEFLRECGPRRPSESSPGRGALAFHRDLRNRHSVVAIGPVPEDVRLAFSTNPEDRKARAAGDAPAEAVGTPAPTDPVSLAETTYSPGDRA